VACAVKDHIPGAFVAWLAEDWASELLRAHPAIDQRITVPRRWTRSLPQILRMRRQLRALRFDAVLDLQGVRSTVLAALLSGAPRRIGFVGMLSHQFRQLVSKEKWLRSLSHGLARVLNFELVQSSASHIVDRYLEILAPLGVRSPQARFNMPESDEDARAVEQLLRDAGLTEHAYAVINAGGPTFRMWPADRLAKVAGYLGSAHALPTIVVGWHGWELQAGREIVAASSGHARLAAPMSLAQVGCLARRSRVFISSDTGPLHLAAAVGAPCIGLIGHALAEWFRPYGQGNILLKGDPVPPHRAHHGGLGAGAMKAIEVDAVCRACDQILRASTHPATLR